MAKKQTRRSISVSAERYAQIERYCAEHQLSKSAFIERIVKAFFGGDTKRTAPSPKKEALPSAPPTDKGNVKFL